MKNARPASSAHSMTPSGPRQESIESQELIGLKHPDVDVAVEFDPAGVVFEPFAPAAGGLTGALGTGPNPAVGAGGAVERIG
jgi:hypothetical protein